MLWSKFTITSLKKKDLLNLSERGTGIKGEAERRDGGGRERKRDSKWARLSYSICWFICQLATMVRASQTKARSQGIFSGLPCRHRGPSIKPIFCWFPTTWASSWIGKGTARMLASQTVASQAVLQKKTCLLMLSYSKQISEILSCVKILLSHSYVK